MQKKLLPHIGCGALSYVLLTKAYPFSVFSTMDDIKYTLLINRYLDGLTTHEEERQLYEWLSLSPENMARFRRLKEGHVRMRIAIEHGDTNEVARRKVEAKIRRRTRRRRMGYSAAACIAVLLVAGAVLLGRFGADVQQGDLTAFETERGEQREVTLPDGSVVTLNAESRVSYIFEEQRGLRLVYLTGEAFFDVVSDPRKPFIVRTDCMDARVLGTRFNISAYPDDRSVETTIMSGRVALSLHGSDARPVEVTVNDRATLVKGSDSLRIGRVDASVVGEWMNGALVFREAFLGDIARKLERTYDISIELRDSGLSDLVYTATFDKGTAVEEILTLFALTSPIEYTRTANRIVITHKPRVPMAK